MPGFLESSGRTQSGTSRTESCLVPRFCVVMFPGESREFDEETSPSPPASSLHCVYAERSSACQGLIATSMMDGVYFPVMERNPTA